VHLDENQFAFMYFLLEGRAKGEYVPLSMLRTLVGEEVQDARVIALSLENAGLAECVSDDRLTGNARYKYKLTPAGLDLITDILRTPSSPRLTHTVHRPK